ncbi:GspE/PulE family protein [Chitinimonas sp. BJB300]|uniref:GspE/PulE family protein n=1 Tax=Chitinimonas sp. BJB300 TaxID=1559339 RepID=UPI000C0EB17F|nr:GspE/PulE family protein [Chitinimonas sp. BJB300]PHV10124.1 type II secretion system protein E [Chitinimonas sp. BJB300]TSJ90970.1 type II/IV secretion system protein [Chitinimonas sp. BJB300]
MKTFMPVRDHADMRLSLKPLVDALVAEGHLTPEVAEAFLIPARTSANGKTHPFSVIAPQGWRSLKTGEFIDSAWLGHWLGQKIKLPWLHIDPLKINVAAVSGVVSHGYAKRYGILPIAVDLTTVTIATAEPFVREWEDELSRILKREIKRVMANPEDIARYLPEFYNLSRFVKQAVAQSGQQNQFANFEQLIQLGRTGNVDANDHHIVSLVDWLFQYAFTQRASDIHLEPRREAGHVRFRIDGMLHSVYQVPPAVMSAIISRIKVMGRMDLAEKRRPQDGRLKTKTPDGREIELRLSTMPTAFGEKLVMRIFDPAILVRDFGALGFGSEDEARWQQFVRQPYGIVLVTGPTGSGKTTTLYTTLKQLATEEVNVCTVEDPIEMIETSFNQMQVQHNIDLTFAECVRTLLRQDPDIIMVGEIRDRETADMAIQAALTGHLVLSTLHTNDASSAVTRMLELGVPPYLVSSTVVGVMAQRLVRTLCPHCKQPGGPLEAEWNALVMPWKVPMPMGAYKPVGCLECRNTGYLGRLGLYEMLTMSKELRRLVATVAHPTAIREQALSEGLTPLKLAGAQKIAAGLTTLEEVIKVVPAEPD